MVDPSEGPWRATRGRGHWSAPGSAGSDDRSEKRRDMGTRHLAPAVWRCGNPAPRTAMSFGRQSQALYSAPAALACTAADMEKTMLLRNGWVALMVLIVVVASSPLARSGEPRPFLIDTDTASDDAVALLMGLAQSGGRGGRDHGRRRQRSPRQGGAERSVHRRAEPIECARLRRRGTPPAAGAGDSFSSSTARTGWATSGCR